MQQFLVRLEQFSRQSALNLPLGHCRAYARISQGPDLHSLVRLWLSLLPLLSHAAVSSLESKAAAAATIVHLLTSIAVPMLSSSWPDEMDCRSSCCEFV
jgi:hypothetical protein